MQTDLLLILISALAGALHVLAPDHWVPASLLSWQRRWSVAASVAFASLALTAHVLLGAAIYFAFDDWLRQIAPAALFPAAMVFVIGVMVLRSFRFSRLHDVQRLGPHSWWGALSVLLLLGPCESVVPIFLKASSLGAGYLLPLVAFLTGSVLTGCALVVGGRFVWNRPYWLMSAFDRANARLAALPVAAGVTLGLRFLFRLG